MKNKRILIVAAHYYDDISINLGRSTKMLLKKNKLLNDLFIVPGIFEIPVVISKYIKKYDGFIALGCVIKGETPHFDFISKATTDGIMKLSIDYKKPIGNGIITCLNKDQAVVRSKTKGQEAVNAVISVLSQSPEHFLS
jgi:6,7-dimethyl-8-ribityllumazine synthase